MLDKIETGAITDRWDCKLDRNDKLIPQTPLLVQPNTTQLQCRTAQYSAGQSVTVGLGRGNSPRIKAPASYSELPQFVRCGLASRCPNAPLQYANMLPNNNGYILSKSTAHQHENISTSTPQQNLHYITLS